MNRIKTVFVSDIHLGSKYSKTKEFYTFLRWVDKQKPENVYIVGDFIDGWKLKRNWYWSPESNLILRKLFSLAKHGSKIFYVAGNHDEFLRHFIDEISISDFAGIKIDDEFIYKTVKGDRLLVIHGDQFDAAIQYDLIGNKFWFLLGDYSYDFLISLNNFINKIRNIFHLKKWSLSKSIKFKFKQAVKFISDYEVILSNYAKEKKCNGVVTGHIHCPDIKVINGIDYYNCGDWVESNTALIEYYDGSFKIFYFDEELMF